jgi:hypothetical protein
LLDVRHARIAIGFALQKNFAMCQQATSAARVLLLYVMELPVSVSSAKWQSIIKPPELAVSTVEGSETYCGSSSLLADG